MVGDVLTDKAFDEVVAVVVARLQAQLQWVACGSTGGLQQFRLQLVGEEFIGIALVHQQGQALDGIGDQRHGIPGLPFIAIIAQVAPSAFSPHGTCEGATIGEKADTLR